MEKTGKIQKKVIFFKNAMKTTNEDIEIMVYWITKNMEPGRYYPVKSDKAIEIIKQIIDEGIFAGLEFNIDYTQIRKIGVF